MVEPERELSVVVMANNLDWREEDVMKEEHSNLEIHLPLEWKQELWG